MQKIRGRMQKIRGRMQKVGGRALVVCYNEQSIMSMKITPRCEGEESLEDYSFKILLKNPELIDMERGIRIFDFSEELKKRFLSVEFEILSFMTTTKQHTTMKLFKEPVQFSYNRYDNILPFEYSMVKLGADLSDPCNYINANYITTVINDYKLIATQGPLATTVGNFWQMVYQNDISIIMMFCNLEERNKVKCYKYWPSKDNDQAKIETSNGYVVQLGDEHEGQDGLILRKLKLTVAGVSEIKEVYQYHWKDWSDNKAPEEGHYKKIDYLLDIALDSAKQNRKMLLHCSGGVGRTGTFVSLFNIRATLNYFKENEKNIAREDMKISIFGIVRRLREQRWRMVFVVDQYEFIYRFTEKEILRLFGPSEVQSIQI